MAAQSILNDTTTSPVESLNDPSTDTSPSDSGVSTPTSSSDASPSPEDLDEIWSRNAFVPKQLQGCVHDLITEVAKSQPDALAVCAWDGNLTYSQLDSLADHAAHSIIEQGAGARSVVPLLFSKSRWTSVAMLAVIKAGCSAVALDATQPDQRLRTIIEQTNPPMIISSAQHHQRAASLAGVPVFQLDDSLIHITTTTPLRSTTPLPVVDPSDIVYISFTSGSTGQPKGACISHANVRSAIFYQGEKLGFHRGARVFDFAPYSFDVAWSNFLHTICAGGSLCVASEHNMLSDLAAAIRTFDATLINVTPTVLKTIYPVSCLKTVLLSGEMPYPENIAKWAGRVRLLNTYGPTECTFKCAFSVLSPASESRPDIGTGVAFATWVVDPENSEKLVSTGSTGELYLEGPLVGQGYRSDPEKTSEVFISDPSWLLAGSTHHPGRSARLYKTGDLVKYKPDGNLLFVGRKDDSQLKVRGQRVEIGDVEHHVRVCLKNKLEIIVDVITPRDGDGEDRSLGLFVQLEDQEICDIKLMMDGLSDKLHDLLPAFMVPRIYFPVSRIPVTTNGKADRRQLREMACALTWEEIVTAQSSILSAVQYTAPSNAIEEQLLQIWANTLKLNPSRISTTDNFLRLGGDSIAAIHVVAAAREWNLSLAVADLFKTPVLRNLAQVVTRIDPSESEFIEPFALLTEGSDKIAICEHVARRCSLAVNAIQDIYPCTPLQQGMLAMTARNQTSHSSSANYVSRTAFELPFDINLGQFEEAWSKVVKNTPITRTRIVDVPREGLVQVVVDDVVPLKHYSHMAAFLAGAKPMGLETRLCRVGIVKNPDAYYFVLEMHHSVFDRWCNVLIMDAVEAAYQNSEAQLLYPFQSFIKYILQRNASDSANFWTNQLSGPGPTVYPPSQYSPEQKLDLDHVVEGLRWPSKGITASTTIRSALTILLASYTNSDDVIFGATVSGRQAPIPGIERISGPTIGAVPVRVKFDWNHTIEGLQQQLQNQSLELADYEQYGLQNIQRISKEVENASRFQVLLVVQAPLQGISEREGGLFSKPNTVMLTPHSQESTLVRKDSKADSMGIYNSYPMMIICHLDSSSNLTLKINYDTGAIKTTEALRLSQQFERLIRIMCDQTQASSVLRDITSITTDDLDQIFKWNTALPKIPLQTVVELIDRRALTSPGASAISSWDQELTYRQLKEMSVHMAQKLRSQGVKPGSVVVLCFEKSSWLSVSMLSILRVGATALPVSATSLRQSRARSIAEKLQPQLVLVSGLLESCPFEGLIPALSIMELISGNFEEEQIIPHRSVMADPAVLLFTSGSTGIPKSIQWNHATLSSNIQEAIRSFKLDTSSRVFQFAGYDFDVSHVESLSTLAAGGCLCIPSESDRSNRLTEVIQESKANWIGLTPSVSETLTPGLLPSLKSVVFSGERLQHKAAMRWVNTIDNVYNWYGPAEASVATFFQVTKDNWLNGSIGRTGTNLAWLVQSHNHHALAPIGAVAEFCIEGPIVASYAGSGSQPLNESSFFTPQWNYQEIFSGENRRLYKTGDLVKYSSTGDIIFLGRKHDSQRKLRGQRVDLGDIEHHVLEFLAGRLELTVVAEIFTPSGSNKETLALFVSCAQCIPDTITFIKQHLPIDDLEEDLAMHLPSYMIPKVYVPLSKIPITHTGKVDRRQLRQIGTALAYEQLLELQPRRQESRKPSSDMETTLQILWAETVGIEQDAIFANDNFLRIGGDSITAMRLVGLARAKGFSLTVTDIFEAPQLEKMAMRMELDGDPVEDQDIPAFSLLDERITEAEARSQAAQLCSIPESRIVDVYPCTELQLGLLALGVRKHGQYISRSVLGLQATIDADRLENAWIATVDRMPILRTRIVDLPRQGLVQVVTDNNPIRNGKNLGEYLDEDETESMDLGTELCRAAIVDRDFILTIHHSTYDGSMFKMVLEELECQYLGTKRVNVTPFQNFIQYLSNSDPKQATQFWKKELSGIEPVQFPSLPTHLYQPQANDELEHQVFLQWPQNEITASTIIRSAWSILAAQHTAASDVIFGVTVSGRQANLRGVENCVGPTISTVPVTVSIDGNDTIDSFLRRSQKHMIDMIPYEQFGLQNIQRLGGLHQSRILQTLLVIQPVAEGKSLSSDSLLFKARSYSSTLETRGTDPFNTYALMLICELTKSGLVMRLSFDNNIIDNKQMHRIANQFEGIIKQLCDTHNSSTKINFMQTASEKDVEFFWSKNLQPPREPDTSVVQMIASVIKKHPDSIAIDAWDGQLTYRQLDCLSDTICQNLITQGLSKGAVMAICFEKMKWTPVVQLAGLKAEAVILMQSTTFPEDRIAKVFKNVDVQIAVASESCKHIVSRHTRCFTVDQLTEATSSPLSLPIPDMSDPAAIMVSSGSTGEPKQILWSQRTMAANVRGYGDSTSINADSRVFQFASYDFDVSTIEVMATFVNMGRVCIPSDSERLNRLALAINHFNANHINLTPSTARLLGPGDVPSLKILVLAGENLLKEDVRKWEGECRVINWYGPAEASSATFCDADTDDWYNGVIGRAGRNGPTRCWIVDPTSPTRLSPLGAIGELALEGPTSAVRYIGNDALSKTKFLESPNFLSARCAPGTQGKQNKIYLTGDLVKYDSNDNLVFLGRQDSQLKLRGQLVSPAEVEHCIATALGDAAMQVAVDAVTLQNSTSVSLVAFITVPTQPDADTLATGVNEKLKAVLPDYAIPSCYISVPVMPSTATGKRDHAKLLEIGASFEPRYTSAINWREPVTTAERVLRGLWSTTLGLDPESISIGDSFLRLGDSIQAMRLVGISRQQGLVLTVAEIFQHPVLADMAKLLRNREDEEEDTIEPFALVKSPDRTESMLQHAAALCKVTEEDIEDVFPCTSLQEGLLALTMKTNGRYIGRNILKLAKTTDLVRFREAWEKVVSAIPILRTLIVDLAQRGLVQAVLRNHSGWIEADSEKDYLQGENDQPMGLGTPLMRCGLFSIEGSSYFALTLHHSIYDGLTVPLIMEYLESFYDGIKPLRLFPFQSFVKYLSIIDRKTEAAYWKEQFQGLEAPQFPALPSSAYEPQTDSNHQHIVRDIQWRIDDITQSTVIRTAYALLCSQYTNSPDVVFGTVVDGRKAAVRGIERIAGPTIATVPIRVRIDDQDNVLHHLQTLQKQATNMIPYEQTGLSNIRHLGEDAQQACQFQTMIVVQPQQKSIKDSSLFAPEVVEENDTRRYNEFNSYSLSIICSLDSNQLKIDFCFDSAVISKDTIKLMGEQFDYLLKTLCDEECNDALICDINSTTDKDLNTIWNWNSEKLKGDERCYHHIFAEVANTYPNAIAATGWDAELTYAQLDACSTDLAHRLVDLGVKRNQIIPLCFEKSVLTLVALLGVMKAGGGVVFLDASLPDSRLESIVQQFNPHLIISSPANQSKSSRLVSNILVLDVRTDLMPIIPAASQDRCPLPYVDPSDCLYSVFTSGTTGTPKGCLIQHRNFSSAVTLQREFLGYHSGARVYDFSSYSFDAVHWTIFHTLAAGGTLCVPSDDERKSNLTESIRNFKTTHIGPTPSLARLIDPERIPTLKRIYFGGESLTKEDISRWMPQCTVTNMYGPSECSSTTVFWRAPDPVPDRLPIGYGVGASTWVVDTRSSGRLAPVGTIGELWLEGPLVGIGYLNNKEKTDATYLEDPKWLLNGSPDGKVPGRRGRMYKTGDLVKYDPVDGALIFVSRKDTQVKLRGQRIELAEIEYHTRNCLAERLPTAPKTVAEVVVPKVTGRATLMVFVELEQSEHSKVYQYMESLKEEIGKLVPSYMVPAAFMATEEIPLVVSGKTDRRRLRELGSTISMEQLGGISEEPIEEVELNESQLLLQKLWANILGISSDMIHSESSFLRLGGDSISAMRLAVLARSHHVSLTVQNILKAPMLSKMSSFMETLDSTQVIEDEETAAFSLLKNPDNKEKALQHVALQCNVEISNIEDIFPCTGVQKSLLSMTAKSENSYIARSLLRLRANIDLDRLERAWEIVSKTSAPILCYRIVEVPKEGLVQVQLNRPITFAKYDTMESYLEKDQTKPMGLGTPLTRISFVKNEIGDTCCVLTQHHAIYDGYSMNLLLTEVSNVYSGIADDSSVAPFQAFIKHIVGKDKEQAREFWRFQFADSDAAPFPELPEQTYQPKADSTVKRHILGLEWPKRDETASTIIRAAWSILTARYTDTHDVLFGTMVTGRQAPLPGINRMIAPLINAVPIRVKFEPEQSISDLLQNIQKQSIDMITFEQTELLDIRRIDINTERGTRFNTLLVVQPPLPDGYGEQDEGPFQQRFETISVSEDLNDFNPNAVMIICQLTESNGLQLEISFDSKVVSVPQMEFIASQFEHILHQVCASTTETVQDISAASIQDIQTLWKWNSPVPAPISECIHDMIGKMVKIQPDAPAIDAWDGKLTYKELDDLSNSLALRLISLGAKPGTRIPLCFEKSKWYPVGALAVIKTGAACIAIDSTQPESRLRSIVNQVDPILVLTSANNEYLVKHLSSATTVIVSQDKNTQYSSTLTETRLPNVTPSDTLYIVFTSGSTGTPKGVVTTHQNFASAATHQADILHIQRGTRVFDFVSYSFDVSWSNHLQTLIRGGCLCIPSEWERKNDITGAFNRMNCSYSYFTPSVAQSLDPASLPKLRTLAMGGELIRGTEVARWKQAETVIGIYGPAECAQALSFARLSGVSRNGHVGYSYGARTWLVQPGRPEVLAAIGTVGELIIEGPTVSSGYFGDKEKTRASYIENPCWLADGAQGYSGRRGTVYRTGDLLRYNTDGSMDFIGRKDGLIKLRGQRIELAEVEYHVRSCLGGDVDLYDGIAAEIITPQNSNSPILAIFVSIAGKGEKTAAQDAETQSMGRLEHMEEELAGRVPVYMVPAAYIHLDRIPMTTTNKTDRRTLREIGGKMSQKQLAQLQTHGKKQRLPSTNMEKRLQALWASVMDIDPVTISAESSFFRIGGESIAAMRLVAAAREQDLAFSVADIFKAPRLSQLALLVTGLEEDEIQMSHEPFSLLDDSDEFVTEFVQPVLNIDITAIRDIVPATDFQERAVLDAMQDPPGRYPHWIFDLPQDVDFVRLQKSCCKLVDQFDILHTVFVRGEDKLWQLSLFDMKLDYATFDAKSDNIKTFVDGLCKDDLKRPRQLGHSFVRFMAIKHDSGHHKLVLRISHSQFDGFSWSRVLETLSRIYNNEELPTPPAFSQYIYFSAAKKDESLQYWSSKLEDSSFPSWSFGSMDECGCSPDDRFSMNRTIAMPDTKRYEGISPATIFHSACALALSRLFGQEEVVFGRLRTGRSMLPSYLQDVVGPTMTEVPIRVTVKPVDTLASIAPQLQAQFIEDSAHEAAGMVEIVRNCTTWSKVADHFGWRTAFQQADETEFSFLGSPSKIDFYRGTLPARNRPEIYATPRKGKLELEFEGNRKITSEEIAEKFIALLAIVMSEK